MKINYFYGSVSIVQESNYTNNLEFELKAHDKETTGDLIFRYPYGNISPEKAQAVSNFVKTISDAFDKLERQLAEANELLGEEEFAPQVLESSINGAEETTSEETETTESEGL